MRAASEGSAEAEQSLCRRFLPAVTVFAARRLRDPELRRALVQDSLLTFVEAVRSDRVADPSRAGAYLLGVCRNLLNERVRSDARRERLMERFGPSLGDAFEGPRVPEVRLELLEDCLSQLTQRARAIVRRSYVDEGTTAEIAAELRMGETNVRVARHRALGALRECIEGPISYDRAGKR